MLPFSIPPLWLHGIAGGVSLILGIVHILRASPLVKEFRLIVVAHRRILLMALVSHGLLLCCVGLIILAAPLLSPGTLLSRTLSFFACGMLLVLSIWTGSTGARSEAVLLRFSHFVTIAAAGLVLVGLAQG